MREKFKKFMAGRYGVDSLSRSLLIIVMLIIILAGRYKNVYLDLGGLVLLIYVYSRIFSKNIAKRYSENQKYLNLTKPIRKQLNYYSIRFKDRKNYKYTHCPYCNLEMRVPKNKGKVIIRCKKCNEKFEFRT